MRTQVKSTALSIAIIFVVSILTQSAHAGRSASAVGTAKAKVSKSISISNNSDLDFGEGFTGDGAATLNPAVGEGAQFTVTGERNRAYDITLPASVTVTTGDGVGANRQIVVNAFSSNPAASGNLGAAGTQSLRVGATRAALLDTQESGDYSASFTVTVAYQ